MAVSKAKKVPQATRQVTNVASANVKRSRRRLGTPPRSLQPGNRPGNTKFVRELYVYVRRVAVTLPSTSGIEARQLLPPREKRRAPGATQRKEYFIMRGNSSSLEAVASSRWLDYRRRGQRELQGNSVTPPAVFLTSAARIIQETCYAAVSQRKRMSNIPKSLFTNLYFFQRFFDNFLY